jgi:hypothetical protein
VSTIVLPHRHGARKRVVAHHHLEGGRKLVERDHLDVLEEQGGQRA